MSINLYKGYSLSIMYMLIGFTNKYIARKLPGLPTYVLLSARFAFAFVFLFPLLLRRKSNEIMITTDLRLQILRAFTICIIIFLTYVGYQSVPLGIASTISASEPIFVAFWGLILGEENGKSLRILIPITLLGIIGMIIISSNLFDGSLIMLNTKQIIGIISLLLANIICSGSHYLSALLGKTNRSETTLIYNILFVNAFMLVLNMILGLSGNGFNYNLIKPYTLPLILLGLCAASSSWIGLEALKSIDPNTYVGIQNLSLPFAILVSRFVEGEKIGLIKFIGIIAIFLSTWMLSYKKFHKKSIDSGAKRRNIKIYTAVSYVFIAFLLILAPRFKAKDTINNTKHGGGCYCCH